MKKSGLLSGALILSVGGILSKIFSAIYRIGLTRILGGVGIGIYQLIFPFYSLCVVLATAGLPMAISKIISKNKGNELAVVKKCFLFTSFISLALTFSLILSSKGLAILQGDSRIWLYYIILAPTIIIVAISSVIRGYFQGKHNFMPSAVSNICEQFIKLFCGLILSLSLVSISIFAAVVGAFISIVISEIISLLILVVYFKKVKLTNETNSEIKLKTILKDIIPITLTNIILPISAFIDSIVVVNLLSVNFSSKVSIFLYGLESGAVSSLVGLPTIFSFAIASVILPNIANNTKKINKEKKLALAIKTVLIITIPFVLCFILVPNKILDVLYADKLMAYGVDGFKIACGLLAISGLGIVFMAINQVYSSSLQALDERYVTIRNLTIAVVLKFVIQLIFMPSKVLNIYVLAIANTLCYIVVMVLNYMEINQHFKIKFNFNFTAKLTVANCALVLTLISIMSVNDSIPNTILAFGVSSFVYLLCLLAFRMFNRSEKAMFKYKV